jgi:glycosyltransferase involved in cell wall biosynthesis
MTSSRWLPERDMQILPLVSILINNYNYAHFLGEAIESALGQTYDNVEVVVVDDGSTDDSLEVMKRYGDRIVNVAKRNGGQASAFNAGFANCRGEVVCFLDADDKFDLGKVARVVQVLTEHPGVGWCWDVEQKFENESGKMLPRQHGSVSGSCDARQAMATGSRLPRVFTACSGLSFRRATLQRILPMPEEFRITADGYIKLASFALSVGWVEPGQLTLQRIHSNNLYTNQPAKKRAVSGRVGLLIGIYLRERFSGLEKAAMRMATRGLGMCWVTSGVDPDCKKLLSSYLARLSPAERLAFRSKSAYWGVRAVLQRW